MLASLDPTPIRSAPVKARGDDVAEVLELSKPSRVRSEVLHVLMFAPADRKRLDFLT